MSTKDPTSVVLACFVCKNPKASRCVGCGKVAYCSKDHQKSHWKTHKAECQAWKILESPALGRYLVAIRDIKPGEIILQEPALVICPPRVTLPVCLGCYSEFEEESKSDKNSASVQEFAKPVPCSKNCGFPLCGSVSCMESLQHEPECTAAWSRGGVKIRNFGSVHPTYEAIGILRVLSLMKKCPENYAKFMSLKSHEDHAPDTQLTGAEEDLQKEQKNSVTRTVSLVQDFFRQSDVPKDTIKKILSILETNAHEIPIPDANGQITRHLIGVYHTSSFLEHNCVPNCIKTWDSDSTTSNHEIQIRASTLIKRGDHLSISYVDPMWGTVDRIHFLRISKNFTCRCQRCSDPTELSTHFSSIRCQQAGCLALSGKSDRQNMRGLIAPEESEEKEWKCNSCNENYPPAYFMSIVEKAGRELEKLHQNYGNIEAEEEFIKKFGKVLSPNHFYLLEIKLGLAQIYGRTQDEPLPILPPKKLCRKLQLCEELLGVFDVILPGYNRLRALILYERQAALGALSNMRRAVEEISFDRHREELIMCSKWLLEAIKVLGWEHENSIERKRADGGIIELEELKLLILGTVDPRMARKE